MRYLIPAFLALAGLAQAQVADGSTWSFADGEGPATVDVVANPDGSVTVQVTDGTGFTPATPGTAGANSTPDDPTCNRAPARDTNSPNPNSFRVNPDRNGKGKLQKKNARGKWVNGTKTKKPKRPIAQGQTAPGEEGTSLPDPGYVPTL